MKSLFLYCIFFLAGCAASRPALKTVESVDLRRYMGAWYVIACIPSRLERDAYNAIETYTLNPDGTIHTVFTFNKGSFEGPIKRYEPKGFVKDAATNSTWGMQFVWPIKAEYLITYVNADYSQTIVSRSKRDLVWIMARTAQIPEADYQKLVAEVSKQGYDTGKLRKVPQRGL